MDAIETILAELQDIKKQQGETFATLSARIDAIDRQTDIPLSPSQAAVFLNCSKQTVFNYQHRGLIQKVTRNGLVGYLRQDLEKLKRNRK